MIHLVHTLGGCGGTLLSRCLGVLPGAAVLSEVNPGSVKLYPHFHPLYQDERWLHLLDPAERERFSQVDLSRGENFKQLIARLHQRAGETGRHLVLRDFNYIDFIGVPFDFAPPRRLTIYNALPPEAQTAAVAFIRHPLDQWVSLCKHEELLPALTPEAFCAGYAAFLRKLQAIPIYKYEEFLAHPEETMRSICSDLALPFEASFLERFHTFDSVTGDFTRIRDTSISPPKRKPISPPQLDEFLASSAYKEILDTTGYFDQVA